MKHRMLFLAVVVLALGLGCAPNANAGAPKTPDKDMMDSPIPPGDTPGGSAKKLKVCPDGQCEGAPIPIWSRESGFVGMDGQGMGYCVTYTLPDGTPGRVDVFHKPTDDEGLRQSVANAIRVISTAGLSRCMERASKKPLHAQAKAAEVCRAQVAQVERRAGGVSFAWEPERPFMMVGTDPIVCTCSTLQGDPSVMGPRYSCGGPCGNCISCL